MEWAEAFDQTSQRRKDEYERQVLPYWYYPSLRQRLRLSGLDIDLNRANTRSG